MRYTKQASRNNSGIRESRILKIKNSMRSEFIKERNVKIMDISEEEE